MESIKDIFIIGNGPSSSHTIGPSLAVDKILNDYKNIKKINVTLYNSLALTGKGHLTDKIIKEKLKDFDVEINYDIDSPTPHPNTLDFDIVLADESKVHRRFFSIGGGTVVEKLCSHSKKNHIYKEDKLEDILKFCEEKNFSLYEYVLDHEDKDILNYIKNVLKVMDDCVSRGLKKDGLLPGKLKVERKAKYLLENSKSTIRIGTKNDQIVMAYAYAASEENASGGIVATAPTCGSSGVIPGCIEYLRLNNIKEEKILEGLLVAGLIGKLIKTNATVSGAVGGCQAEIGSAASIGAALIMHALGYDNEKIAQASEIALEHSLGLTCDPIEGYVQIPCIERNAIFALKAINSCSLAAVINCETSKINFDDIVQTMFETGKDLQKGYKETSKKGMSKIKIEC